MSSFAAMGTTRDYYADLELSPSADIQEIKKQFRKLALKYHPDRNPGREQEVNSKFQIIQTAHEILSDPQQKTKYDATLSRTSRYPAASGVKGNPWQNVSQQFPTPPRRNQQTRNTQSGAQRWQTRFATGVPPTAKQQAPADTETKKNAYQAFENMRNRTTRSSAKESKRESQPAAPPPPPPRSETARQRAQASFGNRKSGFQPHSPAPGDEPPVDNRNYFSKPSADRSRADESDTRQSRPGPIPDPLSQFRAKDKDHFADSRQSTPYTTHGGEKFNPFDGIPLGRAKSTRESSRHTDSPTTDESSPTSKPRSSSVPRPQDKPETAPNSNVPGGEPARSNPSNNRANREAMSNQASNNDTPLNNPGNGATGPSMYAQTQKKSTPDVTYRSLYGSPSGQSDSGRGPPLHPISANFSLRNSMQITSPSGDILPITNLTPFEKRQHELLIQLIKASATKASLKAKTPHCQIPKPVHSQELANKTFSNSFSFAVDEDTFKQTTPETRSFGRNSVDDINTNFVNEEPSPAWKFSAGNADVGGSPISRSPAGSRTGRRSPPKRPSFPRVDSMNAAPPTEPTENKFDPDGWSDKFGPQTFVPQPAPSNNMSPTRSGRVNSKKTKQAKPVGAFAVPGSASSDEDAYEWRGRKAQPPMEAAESPQAMDIDPPVSEGAETSAPQPTPARTINVEPSRPDWRPGDVSIKDTNGTIKLDETAKKQFHANAVGSEDSEEFRANFDDLKNVAPMTQEASGLKSLEDLKDTLPFDSRASGAAPIKLPKAQPLVFPNPPAAPRLPPTVAISGLQPNMASWEKYLKEFETYLEQWDGFNRLVVDHFMTRKLHIAQSRDAKGYGFLGARGDHDVREYYNWVQQDNEVRRKWTEACEDHEKRFREFMAFRERMK
ncbi:DnaJ domain protein [Paramyrothecium foliicola]|nr:DnaJ domain protein [Paramyrothecium foliicola]